MLFWASVFVIVFLGFNNLTRMYYKNPLGWGNFFWFALAVTYVLFCLFP